MRREHGHSTGRSGADHPDTARQHRQEVARIAAEERPRHEREAAEDRRLASVAVVDDGFDNYDRAELEMQREERAERGQPHPNDWAVR